MNIESRKTKKCVVLGGSFNPPTYAHKRLLRDAIDKIGAEIGLFVPSSAFYVTKKASRQHHIAISETNRKDLLLDMCDTDMQVDTCEYGDTTSGRTLQTLQEIHAKYPDYEIWFIMGCDKLDIFHKWRTSKEILKNFYLLWTTRDGVNADMLWNSLKTDPLIKEYISRQTVMDLPPSTADVSSSAFWKLLKSDAKKAWMMIDETAKERLRDIIRMALNPTV